MNSDPEVARWLKDEAIKREKEVQDAQERLDRIRARELTDADAIPPEIGQLVRESLGKLSAATQSDSQRLIGEVCDEFKDFLIAKNEQYGDSAIDPVRIFSNADPQEQLKVRMDDKLSRLMRGDDSLEPDEDIIKDLLGYWILLQVVRRKADRADA